MSEHIQDSPGSVVPGARILYCRCAFSQTVPEPAKNAVLQGLCDSGASFESVADLCEMAARKDPRLAELVTGGDEVRIAACYPRAVKWLFHQAGFPFPPDSRIEVLNMRDTPADQVIAALLDPAPASSDPHPSP